MLVNALFGDDTFRNSISAYYHSNAQDFFVGLLVAVGIFLLSYRGYDLKDRIVTAILGVTAIGVALFPCSLGTEVGLVRYGILGSTFSTFLSILIILIQALNSLRSFTSLILRVVSFAFPSQI